MDSTITSLLEQSPVVLLVIWLFVQFRNYERENRTRFLDYLREKDERFDATLSEFTSANREVAGEIKTLGQCVTRLDARLKG